VPLVWDVEWRFKDPSNTGGQDLAAWQELLDGRFILHPPDRWLGLPVLHAWARLNGRWKKAIEQGNPSPEGSASPFDSNGLERSRLLLKSRMVRSGYLNGQLQVDTLSHSRGRVTLRIELDPGTRVYCGEVTVNAENSGLGQKEAAYLIEDFSRWKGKPLDLSALESDRNRWSKHFEQQGWFGLTSDFFTMEIDTTGSNMTGKAQLTLNVAPDQYLEDTVPHKKARLDSISFHWHPFEFEPLESRTEKNIQWSVPLGRDIRGLAHSMHLEQGRLYNPEALMNARQSIRMSPLLNDVRVDILELPSTSETETPLHVHFDAYADKRRVMRVNGGLNSAQGIGGEMAFSLSDQDFRKRMEQVALEFGYGRESVTPYQGGDEGGDAPSFFNSAIISAGLTYTAPRLIPFGPDRLPRSNRPKSLISLSFRDEKRPKFQRTYFQISMVERFVENTENGSRVEFRPFEVALTSSQLGAEFAEELADLGSDILASSFQPRAIFGSGLSWKLNPKHNPSRLNPFKWGLSVEFEAAGNLYHWLDKRAPEETTISLPSALGSASNIQVGRYTRWVVDGRAGWTTNGRDGFFGRMFMGVASSSIDSVSVPIEKQFYVGGPNSMRGWQAMGLGPGSFNSDVLRVRGDIRLELNIEYRKYINDWIQLAAFVDAGNIWMTRSEASRPGVQFNTDTFWNQAAVAYGTGIRLDFSYFLLRCDFGKPWRGTDGMIPTEGGWRIHPAVSLPF